MPFKEEEREWARKFNSLPRPAKSPGGVVSDWYFDIRFFEIAETKFIPLIINPPSRYVLSGQVFPSEIAFQGGSILAEKMAVTIVHEFAIRVIPDVGTPFGMRPFSLSCNDGVLAAMVAKKLEELGVKDMIITSTSRNNIHDGVAMHMLESMKSLFANKDISIGTTRDAHSSKLGGKTNKEEETMEIPKVLRICGFCYKGGVNFSFCGRCHKVAYCGGECQKNDWPAHKQVCSK